MLALFILSAIILTHGKTKDTYHLSHKLLRERPRVSRSTDQYGRLHVLNNVHQPDTVFVLIRFGPVFYLGIRSGVGHLRVPQTVAHALNQQTISVDTPETSSGLLLIKTLEDHEAVLNLVGNTHTGGTGTIDDDTLIRESATGNFDGAMEYLSVENRQDRKINVTHESKAARATAPVPWISSLNIGMFLYFSINLYAFAIPKSSKWMIALGKSSRQLEMNRSMNWS